MTRAALLALALSAAPMPALAETATVQVPIQCGSLAEVAQVIADAGEQLLLFGRTGPMAMQVWTNLDTGSWTVIRVMSPEVVCLVMSGDGAEPYAGPRIEQPLPGEPS